MNNKWLRLSGRMSVLLACTAAVGLFTLSAANAEPLTVGIPLDSHNAATQETNFSDLLADSVLAAAPGADFALTPAGELRPDLIDAGKTSTERVNQALRGASDPADTVVIMRLTGAQVRAAIIHGLSRAPSSFDGLLQVSGLSIHYDLSKHGEGRLVSVSLSRLGQPIDPKATYSVAMPRYLAEGALGYFDIWSGAGVSSDTHTTVADALSRYALAHQPVSYQVDHRISGS